MVDYANPKEWGPHFWFMMRSIAHTYPENPSSNEKRHAKFFYTELKYVLPCVVCRFHYTNVLHVYDIRKYLSTTSKLVEWVELIRQHIEEHKNDGKKVIEKNKKSKERAHKKRHSKKKGSSKKHMLKSTKAYTKSNNRIAINHTPKCKTCGQY